jgi:hypothetical protein
MKWSLAARKMVLVVLVSAVVFTAAGFAAFTFSQTLDSAGAFPFAAGVVCLAAFNVYKTALIERAVKKAMTIDDPETAKNYIRLQALFRFLLTGAALLITAFIPFIDILGACAGAVTFHIAIYALRFMKIDEEREGDGS